MAADTPELIWVKSSYSGGANNCVEVAQGDGFTAVRDSKDREGGLIQLPAGAWKGFILEVTQG
ncbi:DUF397 domain-containing protein [Amycolatopsis sp. cmx-4-68]|uniref:DUF397 domain-containing protein n=1 Tax=Amycolatopsis sp. cmx-4-68 TaxID=2790938 RepID=UPI0039795C61